MASEIRGFREQARNLRLEVAQYRRRRLETIHHSPVARISHGREAAPGKVTFAAPLAVLGWGMGRRLRDVADLAARQLEAAGHEFQIQIWAERRVAGLRLLEDALQIADLLADRSRV